MQDVKNLQDFLLSRPAYEDLSGKPYDLDNDGVWSAFDLALMRCQVAAASSGSEVYVSDGDELKLEY